MARTAFDSIRNKIALLQHAMDTTKKTYVLESDELDTDHMSSLTFRVVEDDISLQPYEMFTHQEETNQTSRRSSIENARGRKRLLEEKMYQQLNRIQRKGHRNRRRQSSIEMHRNRRRSLRIKARQAQGQRRSSLRRGRDPPGRFEETVQELNRMQMKW